MDSLFLSSKKGEIEWKCKCLRHTHPHFFQKNLKNWVDSDTKAPAVDNNYQNYPILECTETHKRTMANGKKHDSPMALNGFREDGLIGLAKAILYPSLNELKITI